MLLNRITQAVLAVSLIGAVASSAVAAERETAMPKSDTALVKQIKILPDETPDCSSLKSIVESVTRGCQTNDEKAIACSFPSSPRSIWKSTPTSPGNDSKNRKITPGRMYP